MTVIRPNGISGVTSITSSGDAINFYRSDGTLGPELGINVNVTSGVSTFAALNVTGVLTYEDVASVDSVGIVTARSGLNVTSGNTGLGINSPTSVLHVKSDVNNNLNNGILFEAADSAHRVFRLLENGTGEAYSEWFYQNSLKVLIRSNGNSYLNGGNFGLGTASPGVPLDISSNNSTANLRITDNTNGARIKLVAASTEFDIYNTGGAGYIGTPTNSDILIATNNVERIRIDSSGNMGIGENVPLGKLHVKTADSGITSVGSSADDLVIESDTNAGITLVSNTENAINFADSSDVNVGQIAYNHSSDYMSFRVNDSERVRVDSSGRLLVGTTSSLLSSTNAKISITGDNAGPSFCLGRDDTSVSNGNDLGRVGFYSNVGGSYEESARISGLADGTHASGDKPSRLAFFTSPSGSASPTERMRIDSSGRLQINTSVGTDTVNIVGSGGGINIARVSSGSPSANEFLGAVGFKGYANNSSSSSADARIHAVATANHSGTSAPSALIFSTKPSTTGPGSAPTERMRILSSGGITFNGDTAQANALDDYEEGSWTPTFRINNSETGVTYGNRAGGYIKVGKLVIVWGRLTLTNNGSSTGQASLDNLPFTVGDVVGTTSIDGGGHMTYQTNTSGIYGPIVLGAIQGTQNAQFYASTNTNGNMTVDVTQSNINDNFDCRFTLSYSVA